MVGSICVLVETFGSASRPGNRLRHRFSSHSHGFRNGTRGLLRRAGLGRGETKDNDDLPNRSGRREMWPRFAFPVSASHVSAADTLGISARYVYLYLLVHAAAAMHPYSYAHFGQYGENVVVDPIP